MIKINLLGVRERVAKRRVPAISMEGARATALFIAIFALALIALGAHYTLLKGESDRLKEEMARAEAEKARLAKVKAEYDQFEKRKQFYLRRIGIIDKLKEYRTGPVTMLTALAGTVETSGTIWLTSFDNTGSKVTIDGVAGSVNIVADFIANLKRTGQFQNVEIRESYQDPSFKEGSLFLFSITAELTQVAPAGGKT